MIGLVLRARLRGDRKRSRSSTLQQENTESDTARAHASRAGRGRGGRDPLVRTRPNAPVQVDGPRRHRARTEASSRDGYCAEWWTVCIAFTPTASFPIGLPVLIAIPGREVAAGDVDTQAMARAGTGGWWGRAGSRTPRPRRALSTWDETDLAVARAHHTVGGVLGRAVGLHVDQRDREIDVLRAGRGEQAQPRRRSPRPLFSSGDGACGRARHDASPLAPARAGRDHAADLDMAAAGGGVPVGGVIDKAVRRFDGRRRLQRQRAVARCGVPPRRRVDRTTGRALPSAATRRRRASGSRPS